ncbi:hypothetical protein [Robbsia andropogonis]|uniref:hypothetical protein n=1 Tax=Robbsia andropogonis TaxID=28092 RepID=UPI000465C441|nr:hypothetical protein [Robbsia andropogonis]MCP1117312.1 hypothetical protein [Robbsia andropogonis]MCP1129293.1 hypothetical protein [Robbsia andropogonis]
MNLQLASAWLQYTKVRFTDIHEFAARCRIGARDAGRESAALLLLAAKAETFTDRYSGIPASDTVVDAFATSLLRDATSMRDGSTLGDQALIDAMSAAAATDTDRIEDVMPGTPTPGAVPLACDEKHLVAHAASAARNHTNSHFLDVDRIDHALM